MKIDIDVPDGVSGDWSVETFVVQEKELSQMISLFQTGRGVPEGTYKRLKRNGVVVMSNTPDEIRDFMSFVRMSHGHVLVNGLGLGVLLKALLDKPQVTKVTVIEQSEDVIKLVGDTYLSDERVSIIHCDAFKYEPPKGVKYNAVWHDIWDYITSDNLPEMIKLHRKYGRRSEYQESWCRSQCEGIRERDRRYYY
jgi:hypothetical protein